MPEGGGEIEDTTLFGKYQLCRVLGRGRSGTVYLAKHMELEEYRAIKQVPKTCEDYEQFRKEALILKSIRHPGIPIVYDIVNSEDGYALIEEYIDGRSIYACVSDTGHFSTAMTICYGIQICHLVYILHSARNPILYLDLQPKNLLLCHDTVKLIDFDHAVHLNDAKQLTKRYGTVGCAAPEQYSGDLLDERTDIYAIGAVLHYMLTGLYPGQAPVSLQDRETRMLMKVIGVCLQQDKEKRYQTAEQLCEALKRVEKQIRGRHAIREQGDSGERQISSPTIAVAGACPGAGATHIALGLTAFLRWSGISAMYEERQETAWQHPVSAVRQFAACAGVEADLFGIYEIHGVPLKPCYGKNVALEKPPYPVVVRDYGTNWQTFLQEPADISLLVCGAKPWEWETTRNAIQSLGSLPGLAVIYNQFCGQMHYRLPAPAKETECFLMPYCSSPFVITRESRRGYEAILRAWSDQLSGGIVRKTVRKLYGKGSALVWRIRCRHPGGPLA